VKVWPWHDEYLNCCFIHCLVIPSNLVAKVALHTACSPHHRWFIISAARPHILCIMWVKWAMYVSVWVVLSTGALHSICDIHLRSMTDNCSKFVGFCKFYQIQASDWSTASSAASASSISCQLPVTGQQHLSSAAVSDTWWAHMQIDSSSTIIIHITQGSNYCQRSSLIDSYLRRQFTCHHIIRWTQPGFCHHTCHIFSTFWALKINLAQWLGRRSCTGQPIIIRQSLSHAKHVWWCLLATIKHWWTYIQQYVNVIYFTGNLQ